MSIVCVHCGELVPAGLRVCGRCGRPLLGRPMPSGAAAPGPAFVGRDRELAMLRDALAAATAGHGRVVAVAGAAGIGKTRLVQEFAGAARRTDATVLWGSCIEGDWQPPYAPWVEALGEYARTIDPADLRRRLGTAASPVAQIVPAVRAALPDIPEPAPLSPDETRFRVYDAVTQTVLAAARDQPLVLVLDDLHWADRDSLGLLRYLGRVAAAGRLVLVAIYRDPEPGLDHRHPLRQTLAALHHETDHARIAVRGLNQGEVALYLAQAAEQNLPQALVQVIYAETDGNPYYTREVFRHLVEENKLVLRAGRWSTDFSLGDLGIPDGVRQVVGRRVAHLSPATGDLLRLAAAFTAGFDFPTLVALTERAEEALLDSIDEALAAGLLRVAGPRYDFVHAIVRHALYDELNPDRKARLHRRIAGALEQVGADRDPEHAAELAAQYHASAALPGAERGIPYALAAAERALAASAPEQAVTFLRVARDLAHAQPPAVRADILCRLAVAEAEALLLAEAARSVAAAVAALVEAGAEPAARAGFLAVAARTLKDGGASPRIWEPLVEQGLALAGDRPDLALEASAADTQRRLLWARLTLLRDRFEPVAQGEINAGRWLGHDPQAVAIVRAHGDEGDYAQTLEPLATRTRDETDAILALARTWRRPTAVIRALNVVVRDLYYCHDALPEAAERAEEFLAASERYGSIPSQVEALILLSALRAVRGEPRQAWQPFQRAQELAERLGSTHRLHAAVALLGSGLIDILGGDLRPWAAHLTRLVHDPAAGRSPVGLMVAAAAVRAHGWAGDEAAARRLLGLLTPILERVDPRMYGHNGAVTVAACGVWEIGAVEFAASYRRLARDLVAAGRPDFPALSNDLTVARMAALLGDPAEAEAAFARARTVLEASGQRTLRAIVDHDEALVLTRATPADRPRIARLLAAAAEQFATNGMDGWLTRTLDQRRLLDEEMSAEAAAEPAYPDRLTGREVAVLRLVAGGQTNKEIAAALCVSVPTIERHVANIYGKIGARNRVDATAYALSHDLGAA